MFEFHKSCMSKHRDRLGKHAAPDQQCSLREKVRPKQTALGIEEE